MITISDLSQQTGMKVSFIRRVIKLNHDLIGPHIQRGDSNSIMFSSNAIVIFEQIRKMKEEQLTLPEIRTRLLKAMPNPKIDDAKPLQSDIQSHESGQSQPALTQQFIENLILLQRKLEEEKDTRLREKEESARKIRELEIANTELRAAFKLLPEGKTPQQVKDEWEKEQRRKMEVGRIVAELRSIGVFQLLKRKRLLDRLEELTEARQNYEQDYEYDEYE